MLQWPTASRPAPAVGISPDLLDINADHVAWATSDDFAVGAVVVSGGVNEGH
jgi:hypothetical protein